jgi:hypothetical protein
LPVIIFCTIIDLHTSNTGFVYNVMFLLNNLFLPLFLYFSYKICTGTCWSESFRVISVVLSVSYVLSKLIKLI